MSFKEKIENIMAFILFLSSLPFALLFLCLGYEITYKVEKYIDKRKEVPR